MKVMTNSGKVIDSEDILTAKIKSHNVREHNGYQAVYEVWIALLTGEIFSAGVFKVLGDAVTHVAELKGVSVNRFRRALGINENHSTDRRSAAG